MLPDSVKTVVQAISHKSILKTCTGEKRRPESERHDLVRRHGESREVDSHLEGDLNLLLHLKQQL